MRKFLSFLLLLGLFSCQQKNTSFLGMVKVNDSTYVDQTEITNKDYRQFVKYVSDSIARRTLFIKSNAEEKQKWGQYVNEIAYYLNKDSSGRYFKLNWDTDLKLSAGKSKKEKLEIFKRNEKIGNKLFYPNHERYYQRRNILDTRKLTFFYYDKDSIGNIINIYPDTLGFVRCDYEGNLRNDLNSSFKYKTAECEKEDSILKAENLTNSQKQEKIRQYWREASGGYPMHFNYFTQYYFWNPRFDNYPVVNLTYGQMVAFTNWRTQQFNKHQKSIGSSKRVEFVLPSKKQFISIYKKYRYSELFTKKWKGHNSYAAIAHLHNLSFSKKPQPFNCKKSIFMENEEGLISGLLGNVSEMSSDGYLMGGSYMHSLHELNEHVLNAKKIKQGIEAANAEMWIGFRNIAIIKP